MAEYNYTGCSMLGVFVPGELIECSFPVKVFPGDIIIFPQPGRPGKNVVHRVIAVTPEKIQTQGDNNLYIDQYSLLIDAYPVVIRAKSISGLWRNVSRGAAGLKEFKRNQRWKKLWRLFLLPVRLISRFSPLCYFAPSVELLKLQEFKRDGKVFKRLLYCDSKLVATYNFNLEQWQLHSRWKLFYKSAELDKFFEFKP